MTETTSKKHVGVLLMRGATIDIYIPSYSTTVFSLQLPAEVYAEMEIKNVELATKLTTDFFSVNKIPVTEFLMILQTPLFRKEFPLAPQEKLEGFINSYLDYIPFDSVLSKRVKTDSGVMIIAANGDLIQTVNKMISATSSTIECTTALEGLTIFPKGGLSILTTASADIILKNNTLIKQESFSLTPQRSVEGFEVVGEDEEKKEVSKLPLLIPVFIILLVILGVVYVKSSETPPPVAPKKNIISPTSAIPTPTPSKSAITIKITTAKSLIASSEKVKNQLKSAGFITITEDTVADASNGRSFVIYSPTLAVSTKTAIQTILKNTLPTIVEDTSRESSYDVIIVIGK